MALLLGRLGIKAAEALPVIIGGIISWILNRAKDVVGWVSQNVWAVVVGIGGLTYAYMGLRRFGRDPLHGVTPGPQGPW